MRRRRIGASSASQSLEGGRSLEDDRSISHLYLDCKMLMCNNWESNPWPDEKAIYIYTHIYIYYNNWNATSTHIWSNCSHSNAFIHFHHLLLGAKVNQCASVQQPTNLHLAPILIWENIEKRHVFPKNLVLSNPTPISSTVSICKT